ncbi:MAG TPA: hypothetical protein VEJ00_01245 [Candidatus Acidoferrales bacterium]|nr:hypothetical protein [Candidatus Acidoferrales bacterium]
MEKKLSRRDLLKSAAGASLALAGIPALADTSSVETPNVTAGGEAAPAPAPSRILPLTSTSEVIIPPRGASFMKFSYDFPEPGVEFSGLRLSFRLHTFENTYGLDRGAMTVQEVPGGLDITCTQLVWAGGQQTAPGKLTARIRKNGDQIEWSASAEMERPIKSIVAIVRGVPRGSISAGGLPFRDHKDDEVLLGYPFGAGALFLERGMATMFNTPLAVIQSGGADFFYLSAHCDSVRAHRFYFQPGDSGYRVELVYEQAGWVKSPKLESPLWCAGRAGSMEGACRPHFAHVEKAFQIPDWETRTDVAPWCREAAMAINLHGMHWTGYIFNDYAKMLTILQWVATQIPPRNVFVLLPAWDGRFYWNYPLYKTDPRMGGDEGFRRLIHEGQRLGYHFMPMFGTNCANMLHPEFSQYADATMSQIDGDHFDLNWVDWDNDRHMEGWSPYMNVGVDSWRSWLFHRISYVIDNFGLDAYFLDIVGGWENNTKADSHEGTRRLVADLKEKYPKVMVFGEMHYDALLSFIPVFHVQRESAYWPAYTKYARAFQHLSHPAPGRGSSGLHESGFAPFDPKIVSAESQIIPTVTVVDDTFDRYRDVMADLILQAKQRAKIV